MFKQRIYLIVIIIAIALGGAACVRFVRDKGSPSVDDKGAASSNIQEQEELVREQQAIATFVEERKKTDRDLDSVSDEEEKRLGTNSELADTDGDGIDDWGEIKVHGTDPLKKDTDGDGKSDNYELDHGTNPKGSGPYMRPTSTITAQ